LRARVERLARRGYPAEWISRERARALEPALVVGDHVREVAFYAAEAWLDAPRLIRALLRAASACGAGIRERAPVRSLRARGGRVEALVADDGEVTASSLVVCVGPSTQAFVAPLGVRVPVGRVPGFLAVTSRPAQPLHRVVHAPGIHLRPDAGGGLLLGAEDVDSLAANTGPPAALGEAAALLLERAARVFPSARRVKVVDTRHGTVERRELVPGSSDDLLRVCRTSHSPPAPSLASGDWTCQNGASSVVTTSSTRGSFALVTRSSSPTRSLSVSTRMPTQPMACAIRA